MTPLVHRQVCASPDAEWFEARFAAHGWTNSWRNGVYDFQHYHSNTHEVLGVWRGQARIQLGGPDGPVQDLAAGDVVVIPAGCAHCRISASADFTVVGAYPDGAEPDLIRGPGLTDPGVPRPATDPVLGRAAGFAA